MQQSGGMISMHPPVLRQQFAIDKVCRGHFSVRFKNGDVLIYRATAVGVVHRVGRNRLPIGCAEVVYLAHKLSVIIEYLHAFSPLRGEWG
jgi:hypothetical protein